MALHEVQLKGYSVRPGNLSLGTFDSYGIEQLHVTLDDTWSGLAVTATFNPPEGEPVEIRVPENGLIDVPAEATAKDGTGTIVYCGVANGVQRISKTQGYNVITHGNVGTTVPFNPSESLATQVLQAALSAEKNSAEANTAAENAASAAQASAESASKAAAEAAAAKPYAESAKASAEAARNSEKQAQKSSTEATAAKNAAQNAQAGAESSATAAAKSAKEAFDSETAAANSAIAAKTSEDAAAKSATNADSTANSIKDSMTQIAANKEAVSQLKEDISDLTDTIISVEKSNVSENVDNSENIESTIIKSNGKLESNSYTTKFTVKKYTNLTKGSYVVKGFCQGNQCLYVLCDKNGGVIKYENSTSQGSPGTKTVDMTIDERYTILYVGGYETTTAVVKKYLDNVKLTTRLSDIYGKKVTLNGDSIAFGAGTGGTGFMDYIATKYNMTLDKKAVSGATIANLSSRYPDKHCICTSVDTMAEDANYIIFEGGYNDWRLWTQIGTLTDTMSGDLDDTKFYGALESICRQALAKWENGKIGFIITHKINDAWRTQKQEGVTYPTLDGYYQAIKDVCEKYSIPYLDLSKVSRLNTELQNYKKYTYNSDGVHPTKDGYQIFYVDTIARWMENL